MCRVLAERKLAVGWGGDELLLFEKRVSGLHNTASTEMKQRHRRREEEKAAERERRAQERKKTSLTDDLTGETEFVFCREMSDALPVREMERGRERERKSTPQNLSCAFFALSFLLQFKTAR